MQPTPTAAAAGFVARIQDIILFPLISLMVAVAVLVFLWGGYQYVRNPDSSGEKSVGRQHMLWGIIGLLVMLSAYALLSIALRTFGIDPPATVR